MDIDQLHIAAISRTGLEYLFDVENNHWLPAIVAAFRDSSSGFFAGVA